MFLCVVFQLKYARIFVRSFEVVTYSSGAYLRASRTRVQIYHRMELCFPWGEFRHRNYVDNYDTGGGSNPNFRQSQTCKM